MTFRKRGGIRWLSIGRFRISFCRVRAAPSTTTLTLGKNGQEDTEANKLLFRPTRSDLCNFGIGLKRI